MKMTMEHYSVLKEQIFKKVSDNKSGLNNKDFVSKWDSLYADYTEGRKLWDLYWQSGGNDWKLIVFDGNPYGGDYTDSHIKTAIKKIYRELSK